jgi:ABC-type histidine transport system ATPase subunit
MEQCGEYMNILEVERLERHFGGRDLWRGLSFVVRAGESLAIKGPCSSEVSRRANGRCPSIGHKSCTCHSDPLYLKAG